MLRPHWARIVCRPLPAARNVPGPTPPLISKSKKAESNRKNDDAALCFAWLLHSLINLRSLYQTVCLSLSLLVSQRLLIVWWRFKWFLQLHSIHAQRERDRERRLMERACEWRRQRGATARGPAERHCFFSFFFFCCILRRWHKYFSRSAQAELLSIFLLLLYYLICESQQKAVDTWEGVCACLAVCVNVAGFHWKTRYITCCCCCCCWGVDGVCWSGCPCVCASHVVYLQQHFNLHFSPSKSNKI